MENTNSTPQEDSTNHIIIDGQPSLAIKEQEQNNQAEQNDKKANKINLPKRKYAIIHGYNGYNYSGNQK